MNEYSIQIYSYNIANIIILTNETGEKNMHQPQMTTHLHQVYPGIEEELCSRHSTHFTQLKHRFEHLYSKVKPMWYVVGKGICEIGGSDQNTLSSKEDCKVGGPISISMAIENGVTIAIAKTENKGNVYINYNKWQQQAQRLQKMHQPSEQSQPIQQQLILNYKGQIQQKPSLSQSSQVIAKQLSLIYEKAIQDISLSKTSGQIIYISSNLPQNCFYQKQALFYTLYVSILMANHILAQYDVRDIGRNIAIALGGQGCMGAGECHKLIKYGRIFQYKNEYLKMGEELVQLDCKSHKFVFVKLGEDASLKKIKNAQNSLINKLCRFQQNQNNHSISQDFSSLLALMKQIKQQFIQRSKQSQSHSLVIESIIGSVSHIDGLFLTQNSQYLILYVPGCYTAELIRKLAKSVKNQQNNNHGADNQDLLAVRPSKNNPSTSTKYGNGKWDRNKNISQYIFSTLPSIGFSILDPTAEIWFNQ